MSSQTVAISYLLLLQLFLLWPGTRCETGTSSVPMKILDKQNDKLGLPRKHLDSMNWIQALTPPNISIVAGKENIRAVNNTVFIHEDETVLFSCKGENFVNSTLMWVEVTGEPVQPDATIQIIPMESIPNISKPKDSMNINGLYLNYTAKKGRSGFGCRMIALRNDFTEYNVTEWFEFAVRSEPNVTLVADASICGQVTFTCEDNSTYLDMIEWIFNQNITLIGDTQLTIGSPEFELESVKCVGLNAFDSSEAFMDYSNANILECHEARAYELMLSILGGVIGGIILGAGVYFTKKLCAANRNSRFTYSYEVTSKFDKDAPEDHPTTSTMKAPLTKV